MKIYFCDLCNESVPHSDLEKGEAFIRNGRVVCANCDRAMSGDEDEVSSEAARPHVRGGTATATRTAHRAHSRSVPQEELVLHTEAPGGPGLWAGLVALVFAAGAVFLLNGKIEGAGTKVEAATRDALTASSDATDEKLGGIEERLAASATRLEARIGEQLSAAAAENAGLIAEVREALEAQKGEVEEVRASLVTLGERIDRQDTLRQNGLGDLAARLTRVDEDLRFFGERLNQLELKVQTGDFSAAGGGGSADAPSDDGAGGATWSSILPDLQSPNSGNRWQAVQALGETGDPGVVSHLMPMLKDVDIFVRMATARVMGDLDAVEAVSDLIDALEDPEPAVQEAAVGSLRLITGKQFGFDFQANESQRAKKVKAWRSWWEKERDGFKRKS